MNYVNLTRNHSNNVQNKYIGGGVAIGIYKTLNYVEINDSIPTQLQASMEILAVKIHSPNFNLIVVNIYVNNIHLFTRQTPHLLK